MKNIFIYFLILSVWTATSCSTNISSEPKSSASSETVAAPKAATPEQPIEQVEDNGISVTGYIDVPPENRAAISPYYGGFVEQVRVLPGQQVKKGEVLFVLRNPDYLKKQQEYLETKEQLSYLKSDYERQQTLLAEEITSEKVFKRAESDYNMALARFNGLAEELRLMSINPERLSATNLTSKMVVYAPFGGSITKVNISRSMYMDAREVAVEMVNPEHLHLELEVFEKDAAKIKVGQSINFTIPEYGDQRFEGEVHLVGQEIEADTRTIRVHGHIKEEKDLFLPGMFVEAEIQTAPINEKLTD